MKITVEPDGVSGRFREGMSLLEIINKLGVRLDAICNGKGLCGQCKVFLKETSGISYSLSDVEKKHLSYIEIEDGGRLACMLYPKDDLVVNIPLRSRPPLQRLQTEGVSLNIPHNPAFTKHLIRVPKPLITDQRSDEDRLLDTLQKYFGALELRFDSHALQRLPSSIRSDRGITTVTVKDDGLIVDIEPGDTRKTLYGAAVDIGTTKIAYYLMNLVTGEEVAVSSMMNPQREFGEDVMTRLSYASRDKKNRDTLREMIVQSLNQLTLEACENSGISPQSIVEVVAVGNTVMHHLFLGLEIRYLALSPYTQVLRSSFQLKSQGIGLKINPNGYVTTLPTVRSFVGADNTAVCLVTRIKDKEKPTLILDIGTNTEINCGGGGLGVYATSTPSGPAFEGWATRCGMTASPGAIERVFIDPDTLEVMYRTIGDGEPVGICGSGFIDILSEMYKNKIIDEKSRINKDLKIDRIRKHSDGSEFLIVRKEDTGCKRDIVITQKDIGELIKAKAAIHAGIMILLDNLKIETDSLEEILMAGAFGSYMDPENAIILGLLPDLNVAKVKIIGNAAGSGAKAVLLNRDERKKAEEISSEIKFIELATDPKFVKEYVDSMYIPYKDTSAYQKTLKALR